MSAPIIDLSHGGVDQADWWDVVHGLPQFAFDAIERLVVVAPHPDDETLGVGGLIAETSRRGRQVLVVSLTDGEAASDEPGLATRRHLELIGALDCLGIAAPVTVERWGMVDGGLAGTQQTIAHRLASIVRPGDLVVGPLDCDGHPDHEAAGAAVLLLQSMPIGRSISVLLYPVWAWHWHDPSESVIASRGVRVQLSGSALDAKLSALAVFASQTDEAAPVLPHHFLQRFDQPFEVLVQP